MLVEMHQRPNFSKLAMAPPDPAASTDELQIYPQRPCICEFRSEDVGVLAKPSLDCTLEPELSTEFTSALLGRIAHKQAGNAS